MPNGSVDVVVDVGRAHTCLRGGAVGAMGGMSQESTSPREGAEVDTSETTGTPIEDAVMRNSTDAELPAIFCKVYATIVGYVDENHVAYADPFAFPGGAGSARPGVPADGRAAPAEAAKVDKVIRAIRRSQCIRHSDLLRHLTGF